LLLHRLAAPTAGALPPASLQLSAQTLDYGILYAEGLIFLYIQEAIKKNPSRRDGGFKSGGAAGIEVLL